MARNFVAASSQYLSNANAILGVTPLTLAAWLNASATGSTQYVLAIGHLTQGRAFGIGVNSGDGIFAQAKQNGVSNSASTTGTISASTWHHACGVFTGDAERYAYLDGGSKASNTTSRVPGDMNTTMIGARADNGPTNYFSGDLGEAAMWDAALTDAEVAVLALGVSPLFVRPGNLVAYWPLIGRTSPEIDPVGGYGMTLNAAPVAAAHPRVYMPSRGIYIPKATASGNTGTVAQTAPLPQQAISGTETFTGTIAQTLSVAQQAISGTSILDATGSVAQTAPAAQQSVAATETFTGTVAQTAVAATQAMAGTSQFQGTIAQIAAAASQAIAGAETISGSIAQAAAAATQSIAGTGSPILTGTIAQTLAIAVQAISGTSAWIGTVVRGKHGHRRTIGPRE